MITIITEMTDSEIFKTYWVPLICKYREIQFMFGNAGQLKRPVMDDWSNAAFGTKPIDLLVEHAKTNIIYITKQNEIPTYELMVCLMKPQEGIIPKIRKLTPTGSVDTNEDSSSFTISKASFPQTKNYNIRDLFYANSINVTTYVI